VNLLQNACRIGVNALPNTYATWAKLRENSFELQKFFKLKNLLDLIFEKDPTKISYSEIDPLQGSPPTPHRSNWCTAQFVRRNIAAVQRGYCNAVLHLQL